MDSVKNAEADVIRLASGQDTGDMYYQTITGLKQARLIEDQQNQETNLQQNSVTDPTKLSNSQDHEETDEENSEEDSEDDDESFSADEKMTPLERKAARKENKKKVKEEKREARKTKVPKAMKKKKKKLAKAKKTR